MEENNENLGINKILKKEPVEVIGKDITPEMLLNGGTFIMKDCSDEEVKRMVDEWNKKLNY